MRYLSVSLAIVMAVLFAVSGDAKTKDENPAQKSAGERIADHTADAVADVLTGEDTAGADVTTAGKKVPPGQAKKGTVPPGWSKGNKTGWDKKSEDSGTKSESPIQQMVKALFGKKEK